MTALALILALATLVAAVVILSLRRRLAGARSANEALASRALQAQRIEDLLTALPQPLLLVDAQGAWLRGFPAPDRTGASDVFELIPPAARDHFRTTLAEAIARNEAREFQYQAQNRAWLAEILPVRVPVHAPQGAAVFIRDVTDSLRAAERLRRLAERNDAILRSSMDGFFVIGPDYRFTEVNEAFCRMTGYDEPTMLDMSIADLEAPQAASPVQHPAEARTGLHQFPTAHRHKDGHVVFLEISMMVLRDGEQKVLVGFARDVTERKRAAEEFARLSRHNELILESAAEGICGVDRAGRITFMNPAARRLFSVEREDPIGRRLHEIFDRAGIQVGACAEGECVICGVLEHGAWRREREGALTRADGSVAQAEFTSTPILNDGQLGGAVVVIRDVTDRRRAEQERRALEARMQDAQRLESLGLLAGGVAHDFNNILVGIIGNADLATELSAPDDAVRDRLRKIGRAAERAKKIVRQMLAYAGRAGQEMEPVDINELLEEVADLVATAAVPKSVTLRVQCAADVPLVQADSGQITQVLTNLLMNAVEAITAPPGVVTVSTRMQRFEREELRRAYSENGVDPGEFVCVTVRDTGCGIAPGALPRIFEPFYSSKAPGRGLGLAAIRGIARAHRGAVRVESRLDEGSCFEFILPVAARLAARPAPSAGPQRRVSGATVLVIDDEEAIRDVVRDLLASRGFHVLTADDGARGIEVFAENADKIDLVLLDMTMPGLDGGQVLRAIAAQRPQVKVIISSGYAQEHVAERLAELRVAAFVHKPYTTDALIDKIGDVLATEPAAPAS